MTVMCICVYISLFYFYHILPSLVCMYVMLVTFFKSSVEFILPGC